MVDTVDMSRPPRLREDHSAEQRGATTLCDPFWRALTIAVQDSEVSQLDLGMPGPHASVEQIHSWWTSLQPAEHSVVITRHGDLLGRIDGVPRRGARADPFAAPTALAAGAAGAPPGHEARADGHHGSDRAVRSHTATSLPDRLRRGGHRAGSHRPGRPGQCGPCGHPHPRSSDRARRQRTLPQDCRQPPKGRWVARCAVRVFTHHGIGDVDLPHAAPSNDEHLRHRDGGKGRTATEPLPPWPAGDPCRIRRVSSGPVPDVDRPQLWLSGRVHRGRPVRHHGGRDLAERRVRYPRGSR